MDSAILWTSFWLSLQDQILHNIASTLRFECLKDLGFIKICITPSHSKYSSFLVRLIWWQSEERLEGWSLVRRLLNNPIKVIRIPIDGRKRKGKMNV